MKLRTHTIVISLLVFATLGASSFSVYAGEQGARSPNTIKAAPAGPPERAKGAVKSNKRAAGGTGGATASSEDAVNDAGVDAPSESVAGTGSDASNTPEPIHVDVSAVPPMPNHLSASDPSFYGPLDGAVRNEVLLAAGALLLVLLVAAEIFRFVQRRARDRRVADALHTVHARLEELAQRVAELDQPAPSPVEPQATVIALPEPEPAGRRRRHFTPGKAVREAACSANGGELAILQKLIEALDSHGADNATGTDIEVEIQHLDPTRALKDLAAQVSRLNFIAATAHEKALREQNFISIAPTRSRGDSLPRQVVRVKKQAVAALRAVAFRDIKK